jgi:hypothetical protein
METIPNCEKTFFEGGPFFHVYTSGLENDLLFCSPEEMDEALNMIALAVYESPFRILAFAIMHNHLHAIGEGRRQDAEDFFSGFEERLGRFLSRKGKFGLLKQVVPGITPINDLKQLRDEIVYVIRNPFVDRTNVNLFAYKWCSAYLYFNDFLAEWMPTGRSASKMSIDQRRAFKHERNPEIDPRIHVLDGVALPSSFVDYHRAEAFFENPRQFLQWTFKNVEAQVDVARRLGEKIVLDDTELWGVTRRLSKSLGGTDQPKVLPADSRVKLVKSLKYDYGASNAQIARCTGFPRASIDELFPLSARKK